MNAWHIKYGSWWMIQWSFAGWISLGIHIEPRRMRTGKTNKRYGPYIDFHILCVILSFGVNPFLSGDEDMDSSVSRGGYRASDR